MKNIGFTLIELMVSAFIFTLVIVMAFGVFSSVITLQIKALATQKLLDEVSFATEYMSRAIRMAVKDENGDCIDQNLNYKKTVVSGIRFENYKGECQEFFNEWDASPGAGVWRLKENKNGVQNYFTSPDFNVISFNIGPDVSWDQLDNEQPRVTFSLKIEGKGSDPAKIEIQTTLSQRNLDIEIQ